MKQYMPTDRTRLRKFMRERRKVRLKQIQKALHIRKALIAHARRHGGDAETIQLDYWKHKNAGFVDRMKV